MVKKLLIREIPLGKVVELTGKRRNNSSLLLIWNNNQIQSRVDLSPSDLVAIKFWTEDRLKEVKQNAEE